MGGACGTEPRADSRGRSPHPRASDATEGGASRRGCDIPAADRALNLVEWVRPSFGTPRRPVITTLEQAAPAELVPQRAARRAGRHRPKNMNLNEVRAFISVADLGSIQAAAKALDWPRATVRRRIDALEARIGSRLLLRDKSGARLTDVGHGVADRGRGLLREADEFLASGRRGGAGRDFFDRFIASGSCRERLGDSVVDSGLLPEGLGVADEVHHAEIEDRLR